MSRVNTQAKVNPQSEGAPKPDRLISTKKAAERLDVHPNTIREFIAQNKLKGYKVGRLIRLDAAEVENFIAEIATGV